MINKFTYMVFITFLLIICSAKADNQKWPICVPLANTHSIYAANFNRNENYSIVFQNLYQGFVPNPHSYIHGFDANGNLLPNFPLKPPASSYINHFMLQGIADFSGIGTDQIACNYLIYNGIYIEILNENKMNNPGWPQISDVCNTQSGSKISDLNLDGRADLTFVGISYNNTGYYFVGYFHNGLIGSKFHITSSDKCELHSLANLNETPEPEIIIYSYKKPSSTMCIDAYNINGDKLKFWNLDRYLQNRMGKNLSVNILDEDHDGKSEIYIPNIDDFGALVNCDGSLRRLIDGKQNYHVSIGDVNGDGKIEIVNSFSTDMSSVFIIDLNGTILPGWPQQMHYSIGWGPPSLASISGNKKVDIIVGDGRNYLYAWHSDGSPVNGFPQYLADIQGTMAGIWASPTITDLDSDGRVDILVSTSGGTRYRIEMGENTYDPYRSPWPMYNHDPWNTAQHFDFPQNVRLSRKTANSVTLSWRRNFEPYVEGYEIHYDKWEVARHNPAPDGPHDPFRGTGALQGNSPIIVPWKNLIDPNNPSLTILGLTPGETYVFSITAYAYFRQKSFFSEELIVTLPEVTPYILLAGFMDSELYSSGILTITAIPQSSGDSISGVELLYQGSPTGIQLHDDGTHGDASASDGLWSLSLPLSGPLRSSHKFLFELKSTDSLGRDSHFWPYLTVE